MNRLLKFGVPFVVAAVCAILTFLVGNEVGCGSVDASIFAGTWCGLSSSFAFEIGLNSLNKESLVTVAGGVSGGIVGGLMFAFAS